MMKINRKACVNSLLLSLIYVGAGTILLFVKPNETYDMLVLVATLICLPATFISAAIIYTDGMESLGIILGVQVIMFLIYWLVIYRLFAGK